MLSQKQLEIKELTSLINAGLSGRVPQEADSDMKNSIQEASWGALGVSTAQGTGRGGNRTLDRTEGEVGLWYSHNRGPS